ncbi:MAG: glycosyltransferase [Magnetococcales bacterium]|nr:glycosyltransferase [Magnetococcales bacterium]
MNGTTPGPVRVAYIMSRFPKITETFILYEMLAVADRGVVVAVFPLRRERTRVVHPEVARLADRTHFLPFGRLLLDGLTLLIRRPFRLLGTLGRVLWGTRRCAVFFLGALVFLPKCLAMARAMERLGITHIHAHFASHPALAAFVIHRLTGIPYSFTAHGSDLHKAQCLLGEKIAASAFTVSISRYNRQFMLDHVEARWQAAVRQRVRVIHCGIDPAGFRLRCHGPGTGPVRILCIASLGEVKGHRSLLEACALLDRQGLEFECHLIGDGPLRRAIDHQVAVLGLGSRVTLHGAQPRPVVLDWLGRADVAVLASVPTRSGQREGIPMVLMEAMAAGLPVVASRLSGIPELVDDGVNGLLVPPGQPQPLAAALERLARDPGLRQRLGRAGRARVEEDFNLHACAAGLAELMAGSGQSAPG